jgi:hypothetical protein
MFWLMSLFFPGVAERRMAITAHRKQLSKDESAPASNGNVFAPMGDEMKVSGGWRQRRAAQFLRNTLVFAAVAAPLVAGALLLGPKVAPAMAAIGRLRTPPWISWNSRSVSAVGRAREVAPSSSRAAA